LEKDSNAPRQRPTQLFAEGKQWHGMRRFRTRHLWRVNSEVLLLASGQNLKRLLQRRGWGRRPFPTGATVAAEPSEKVVLCLWLVVKLVLASGGSARPWRPATDLLRLAS
jgi:hypothetical protein